MPPNVEHVECDLTPAAQLVPFADLTRRRGEVPEVFGNTDRDGFHLSG